MTLIIIFLPLFTAVLSGFLGRLIGQKGSMFITTLGMVITMVISFYFFYSNLIGVPTYLVLGKWICSGTFIVHWGFIFDSLACSMLVTVTCVSSLVHLYSCSYMSLDPHISRFMSYLSLFTFFMLILVTADNFIQLFLGWEGVGLCSYLLIGFWFTRTQANKAALKALIVNRVGDLGFILAIGLVYFIFQSLDFEIVFCLVPYFEDQLFSFLGIDWKVLDLICFFLFTGSVAKSAQIGLHTWLPDAMEGPTPVSALIHAATMVTAGVFLIIRCSPLFEYAPSILILMTFMGAITAFMAATIGLVQNDIKKVIAYSTCSQLGYMVFACGLSGYTISLFHLINHAFFKALLFLAAGSIIHSLNNEQDTRKMGGLINIVPYTYGMMLIGSLSLAGFPFLSGFYSKDLILELAYANCSISGQFAFWAGSLTAFITAVYSIRLLYKTFFGIPNGFKMIFKLAHESSLLLGIPLFILAIGSIFMGFCLEDLFVGIGTTFWMGSIFILPKNNFEVDMEFLSVWVKIIPLIASISGMVIAFFFYHYYYFINNIIVSNTKEFKFTPFYKFLSRFYLSIFNFLTNKWYFDYINNYYFAKPVLKISFSFFFRNLDKGFFELFGPSGICFIFSKVANSLVKMHTGHLYHYLSLIGISFLLYNAFFEIYFISLQNKDVVGTSIKSIQSTIYYCYESYFVGFIENFNAVCTNLSSVVGLDLINYSFGYLGNIFILFSLLFIFFKIRKG